MATNIEEIFRSFVVNKFKEIQEEEKLNSENSESSPNGELTVQGPENTSEGSAVCIQGEGSDQTAPKSEEMQPETLELAKPQNLVLEEEGASKELKTVEVSSSDEVKKDTSKKKSKKHKKHKSKKKKKKKKKEKNEKRSKSISSVEDQENFSSEAKSVWKPAFATPPRLDALSSKTESVNIDILPLVSVQDVNIGSMKEDQPSRLQLDADSGFFGPKCPNEINSPATCDAEMPEALEESTLNGQQNSETTKHNEQGSKIESANYDTAKSQQIEMPLSQSCLLILQEKSVELSSSTLNERKEDFCTHSDKESALLSRSRSKSDSEKLSKSAARSRSTSLARQHRSRSKSLVKVPKKQQISSKSTTTRQRSRSSSFGRRRRSRSSSVGQRQRSNSKSPVRRRRSRSSTSVRYSKSPIRSWWSKSIKNRQRSVSIERRHRSRTKSPARRRRSRSRTAEKRHRSRTRSSVKRIRSRSISINKRRKSRSTSRKPRLRSKSTSRWRRSKSTKRRRSRSGSAFRKRRSRSGSAVRRRVSRSVSPARRRRTRSGSTAIKKRSRSGSMVRRRRSRSVSAARRSRSPSPARRRRSRSPSPARRRRSRSPSPARRRRSRSPSPARRRRSRSPSPARRRRSRSPSPARRRRSRSPSPARRRRSRSPSPARRRRSRSPSPARRRRSRSSSAASRHRLRSGFSGKTQKSRSSSATKRGRTRSTSAKRRHRTRSTSTARKGQPHSTAKNISKSARGRRSRSGSILVKQKSKSRSTERKYKSGSRTSIELRRSRSLSLNEKQLSKSPVEKETNTASSTTISIYEIKLPNITSILHSKSVPNQEQITSPVKLLEPCGDNSTEMDTSTFSAVILNDYSLKTPVPEKHVTNPYSKSPIQKQNLSFIPSPKESQSFTKPSIECCMDFEQMHYRSTQTDGIELQAASINIFSAQKDCGDEILNDPPIQHLKEIVPNITEERLCCPVDEPELKSLLNNREHGASEIIAEEETILSSPPPNIDIGTVQKHELEVTIDPLTNECSVPSSSPILMESSCTTDTSKHSKSEVYDGRCTDLSVQDSDPSNQSSDKRQHIEDALEFANQNLITLSNTILKSEENTIYLKSVSKPKSPMNTFISSNLELSSHHSMSKCIVKDVAPFSPSQLYVISNCSKQDFIKDNNSEVHEMVTPSLKGSFSESSAPTEHSGTPAEQGISYLSSDETKSEVEPLHNASPTSRITSESKMKPFSSPVAPHKGLDSFNRQTTFHMATVISNETLNLPVIGSPRTDYSDCTQRTEQGFTDSASQLESNSKKFSKPVDATVSSFKSSSMIENIIQQNCSDCSQSNNERLYLNDDSNLHDYIPDPASLNTECGSETDFLKSSKTEFNIVEKTVVFESMFTPPEQNSTQLICVSDGKTEESKTADDLIGSYPIDKPLQKGLLSHGHIDLRAGTSSVTDKYKFSKSETFSETAPELGFFEGKANQLVLGKSKDRNELGKLQSTHKKSLVLKSSEPILIAQQMQNKQKTISNMESTETFSTDYSYPHKESVSLIIFPPFHATEPLEADKLNVCVSPKGFDKEVCSMEEKSASHRNKIPPFISCDEFSTSREQTDDNVLESNISHDPQVKSVSIKPDESISSSSENNSECMFDILDTRAIPSLIDSNEEMNITKQILHEALANNNRESSPNNGSKGFIKPLTFDSIYDKHTSNKTDESTYDNAREVHSPTVSAPSTDLAVICEHKEENFRIATGQESLVVVPSGKMCSDSPMNFKLEDVNIEKSQMVIQKMDKISEIIIGQTVSEVRELKECSSLNDDDRGNLDSSVPFKDVIVQQSHSSKQTVKDPTCDVASNDGIPCKIGNHDLSMRSPTFSMSNTTKKSKTESCFDEFVRPKDSSVSQDFQPISISKTSESKSCDEISGHERLQLDVLEAENSSQEKIVKPYSSMSSHFGNTMQKVSSEMGFRPLTLLPKHEIKVNLQEKNSKTHTLSAPKHNESNAPALEQSEKAPHISPFKSAHDGSKQKKTLAAQMLSSKTTVPVMNKSSEASVPLHFKFSKTFKTISISHLCNATEDSSGIVTSKDSTFSSSEPLCPSTVSSDVSGSSLKSSLELPSAQPSAHVESSKSSLAKSTHDVPAEPSQLDLQSVQPPGKDLLQSDNTQGLDDPQSCSTSKHTFPHLSSALSKLGVKQRQYRSRSVAQESRSPSVDRGRASRSRSKSTARRRRSHSKSVPRKKRSQSSTRKKSSHSKSVRKRRSRSRSGGRKRRSQSKSKSKKKHSLSTLSGKRKRSSSKSTERTRSSKPVGKQRCSRSKSKTRRNRLQSKSPGRKGRSRSKSGARKSSHSKTSSNRKSSRSNSPPWRRRSHSKSLSSRSRSRSISGSPRRRSRSRNKGRSLSRSPAPRRRSRSRSHNRWYRSRSRGRWRRSRSLSTSRRNRSRSSSRLSRSLSTKKRKSGSKSPVRRRRSRSQAKQKDKSPISKRKSTSPIPQKKIAQSKTAAFKHSIGLKSLIQKQLSQAKSKGAGGKMSVKEQIPLSTVTARAQLSTFSTRAHVPMSNLTTVGQMPLPNLADVPLPNVTAGVQIPLPNVPPAEQLPVSNLVDETQLSVPDLTTATQWHVPDMSSGSQWPVPDIATGTPWSVTDLGTGTQWPMSDLAAGAHWPMHHLTVGTQWSVPDLAAGTQWAVPDVASGAQWTVPDLTAGTQWTVPDLTAGTQWTMTNLTPGTQWAVPDLTATTQWTVPDLTSGAQLQRADLAPEAQVPGSDLSLEAQVPGSDLATEAQVPGSDLATEAQVPGSDLVSEAQVPPEHELAPEALNPMPDVAAEALVPVASGTLVPDVAAGIPLPDVAAAAQMPVPDVAAMTHMPVPDVASTGQTRISVFVPAQGYRSTHESMFDNDASKQSAYSDFSLSPEEPADNCLSKPIVSPEHQPEADSFNASACQSTFEPLVSTYHTLNNEQSSSSGQFPAVIVSKCPLSSELKGKMIPLDKLAIQVIHATVTEIPENFPLVESCENAECPPDSEPCSASEIALFEPSLSSERPLLTVASSLSVLPTSDESHFRHEHNLLIEPHANSDSHLLAESHSSSDCPLLVEASGSPDCSDSHLFIEPNTSPDCTLLVEPYHSPDHNLLVEPYSKSDYPILVAPFASSDRMLLTEQCANSDFPLVTNLCASSDHSHLVETCVSPGHSLQVDPYASPDRPQQVEPYASPDRPQQVEPYASPDRPQQVEPYASPDRPQQVEPYASPDRPQQVEPYASPDRPQQVEPYASPDRPQHVEPYASPDRPQLVEPYSSPDRPDLVEPYASPVGPDLVEPYASPDGPDLVEPYASPGGPDLVEPYASPGGPGLVEPYASPGGPGLVEPYASPGGPGLVEPYASPGGPGLVEPYASPERPKLVEPYASPERPKLVEPYASPERPKLVEPYASPERPKLVEPYASPERPKLVEPYASPDHVQTCKPCFSFGLTETFCQPAEAILNSAEKHEDEVCSSPSPHLTYETAATVQHHLTYNPAYSFDVALGDKPVDNLDSLCPVDPNVRPKLTQKPLPNFRYNFVKLDECSIASEPAEKQEKLVISDSPHFDKPDDNTAELLHEEPCQGVVQTYSYESGSIPSQANLEECCGSQIKNLSKELYCSPQHSHLEDCTESTDHLLSKEYYARPAQLLTDHNNSPDTAQLNASYSTTDSPKLSHSCESPDHHPLDTLCASPDQLNLEEQCVSHNQFQRKEFCAESVHPNEDCANPDQQQPIDMSTGSDHPHQEEHFSSPPIPHIDEHCASAAQAPLIESMYISSQSCHEHYSSSHKPLSDKCCLDYPFVQQRSPHVSLPGDVESGPHVPLPGESVLGANLAVEAIHDAESPLLGGNTPGSDSPLPERPLCSSDSPLPQRPVSGSDSPLPERPLCSSDSPLPQRPVSGSDSSLQERPVCGSDSPLPGGSISYLDQIPPEIKTNYLQLIKPATITDLPLPDKSTGSPDYNLLDRTTATEDLLVDKPYSSSNQLLLHEPLESCEESFDSPSHSPKNHSSAHVDHSRTLESSAKTNQTLSDGTCLISSQPDSCISEHTQNVLQTDDPFSSNLSQSQDLIFNKSIGILLPVKNTSRASDLPCFNQEKPQCFPSNQVSAMSVESASEDSDNHPKIDHHYKITPPDLLPYDSEQPTGMCSTSEPSSEPVLFNSQPPPKLLPYDSEQPANPFLSIADYSSEQGSSVFHTPPELLPYDSDQPTALTRKQSSEPHGEELSVYNAINKLDQNDPPAMLISIIETPTMNLLSVDSFSDSLPSNSNKKQSNDEQFSSSDLHDNSDSNCELDTETAPHHLTSINEQSVSLKFDTIKGSILKHSSEEEHTHVSEMLDEQLASITSVVHYSQELPCSASSIDEPLCATEQSFLPELLADQPLTKNKQSLEEPLLCPQFPMKSDCPTSRMEDQTEQVVSNISATSEIECCSADNELVNMSESECSTVTSVREGVISSEVTKKRSRSKSLSKTDIPQSQAISRKNDSRSKSVSRTARSHSRSEDRKKSRSKSATRKNLSRSKSVTRRKKSRSKSLVRTRRSRSTSATERKKSRSASDTRKRRSHSAVRKRRSRSASLVCRRHSRSLSVAKRKGSRSRSVARKRGSRSTSTARRRRSRSSSTAHRKRSHSSSVGHKRSRSPSMARRRRSRSHSLSRRRRSRSPSVYRRRRSRSPSVTRRRRSQSVARRRRSRSQSVARRRRSRSQSVARRRRSPSPLVARRRRSPSPLVARRRRSPSPLVARRRRSPSPLVARRRRSPSPLVARRRRSPTPPVVRRRHSRSPSASRKRRSRSSSAPRKRRSGSKSPTPKSPINKQRAQSKSDRSRSRSLSNITRKRKTRSRSSSRDKNKSTEKRRKRSNSKDHYSVKQRRKSRTPPRRKKSRSPGRRASVCKSPVRRRRSRSPVRRKSFSRSPIRRKRSRSRDQSMDSIRSPKRLTDLDKAQLLEIAKANAAAMCAKAGVPLPLSLKPVTTPTAPAEEKITHRTYGVTIQELTEKCKQIAQSKEDDVIVNKPHDSDEEEGDQPFYNHPFKVSEHKPISFSLLNPSLKPAPKNQVTLTKEFPVSSGSQHRKKEDKVYGEWVPVDKKTEEGSKDDVFTNAAPSQF
ncbi:protein SON isoform X2 [Mixophyes fleayi]|uniref:protein SON isoform X2 n=1 Tax=Mixophyes fleayi TaxID=3061075 RepID=UPI003F4D8E1D